MVFNRNIILHEYGPTRDDVMAWVKEETIFETLKYKEECKSKDKQIIFTLTDS